LVEQRRRFPTDRHTSWYPHHRDETLERREFSVSVDQSNKISINCYMSRLYRGSRSSHSSRAAGGAWAGSSQRL